MGFMDLFTRKKKVSPKDEISPYFSSVERVKNHELYNLLASFVATHMFSLNLIHDSTLKSFNDDKGLLDSLVFSATTAPTYLQLKNRSSEEYLGVCGSNAFGRGIYVAGMQNKLDKPISQFTIAEVDEIVGSFRYAPDYELGMKMINIEAGSQQHQEFHDLIVKVANYYLENCSAPLEKENLRAYMQALFNSGITILYR